MKKYLLSRKYFKLVFIIYAFINTLALGYLKISTNLLSIAMIIWGASIIINDFHQKQLNVSNIRSILIISYGTILLLATLINPYSNIKSYLIALLQLLIFLLIYSNKKEFSRDDVLDELKSIVPTVSLLTGLAGICSLIMYFFKFSSSQNGWTIGMAGNRLFGIYFNCNPAAFLSTIAILLAIFAVINKYSHTRLYTFNIIIQLIYIILTQCRTALIILAVIITTLIYFRFYKNKSYSNFKKYFFSSIASIVIFTSCIFAANTFTYLNGNNQETSGRFQINKIVESMKMIFHGEIDSGLKIIDQVSSGRIELLETSFKIWQTSPILGIGAGNFQTVGINESPSNVVKQIQVVHSHNLFIETLVTTGILGASIFLTFIYISFKVILKGLKNNQHRDSYLNLILFILIVCSEFIGGMFDYGVFYVYSLSATLCWLFLGYLHNYTKKF